MFVSIWDAIIEKSDKGILAIWSKRKTKNATEWKYEIFCTLAGTVSTCTLCLTYVHKSFLCFGRVCACCQLWQWQEMTSGEYSKHAVFLVKVRQFQIFEYQLFDPYRFFFAYSYSVHKKIHLPRRQTEKSGSSMCIQIIKYETNCISTDN